MGLAETIATEDEFRSAWPRHATAVFEHVKRNAAMAPHPWTFARAVVRRPYLATVLFGCVGATGERTEIWLSVAPDADAGWQIFPVFESAPRR